MNWTTKTKREVSCTDGIAPSVRPVVALPDGVRTGWVSEEARIVWENRFGRITRMVGLLERETVPAGLRACSWGYAGTMELNDIARWAAERGLSCLPLVWEERAGGYLSGGGDHRPDVNQCKMADAHVRFVIGAANDVCKFGDAYTASDHCVIGRLLGYPSCCVEFFERTWMQGSIDGTWEQLSAAGELRDGVLEVRGGAFAQTLHRHVGVRAVFHLPCSVHCSISADLAQRHLQLAEEIGYSAEVAWTREVLEWPLRWSARNGLAELTSPVHRTVARTDPCATLRMAHIYGKTYPAEGARGTRFPFRMTPPEPRRVLEVYKGLGRMRSDVAAANGFSSYEAMLTAHQAILGVVIEARSRLPDGYEVRCAWDLGGGTRTLLTAVAEALGQQPVLSCVDLNSAALAIGRRLYGQRIRFVHADILRVRGELGEASSSDLLILMPGRLLEQGPRYATELLAAAKRWPGLIVAYQYRDTQQSMPGLLALAREWWADRDIVTGGEGVFAVLPLSQHTSTFGDQCGKKVASPNLPKDDAEECM